VTLASSRITTSQQSDLRRLFAPHAIAVIGASASPDKAGGALLEVMDPFPGEVYAVNPNATQVGGRTSYPSVRDVPDAVDLVVIAVPPTAVPGALADCGQAGVGAAVICTGGFAEAGDEGAVLQEEIRKIAMSSGVRLLGPNTSGFLAPARGLFATFAPGVHELPAGGLAIVAQSGGVNLASAFLAAERGAGISLAVGLGNAVDVGFVDVLEYLTADETTTAVALHIEGAADGRGLMAAVTRLSRVKPVIAMIVGRADVADFARSHTGALAGDWAIARAALEQAGAVVVDSLTDLVDAAGALATTRLPANPDPGVGIVTGQAGPGLIIADTLSSAGVRIPALSPLTTEAISGLLPPITYQRNPVDTGRPGKTFFDVVTAVGGDPGIDVLLVYALQERGVGDMASGLADRVRQGLLPATLLGTGGPQAVVVGQREQLRDAGIPVLASPDRAAFVLSAMIADARAQHRVLEGGAGDELEEAVRLDGSGPLDEAQGKALLDQLGIPTPARRECADEAEAVAALTELGGHVVVKILDAEVTHKTAAGGVRLGVRTRDDLREALIQTGEAAIGERRWLIEQQVAPGIELLVGGVRDASFGAAVLLSAGGVDVEWGATPVVRAAPLSRADADAAVDALPPALLRALGADRRVELATIVRCVGAFLAAHPEVAELDINPLRATDSGFVALDALFILAEAPDNVGANASGAPASVG
jgi:acetate---CoA ligase (ADP-forming)